MNIRSPFNKNLTLHNSKYFNNLPVQVSHGALVNDYLERMERLLQKAISDYTRIFALRIDLRLPSFANDVDCPSPYSNVVISKFFASFKEQLKVNLSQRLNQGKRHIPCIVRYIWAAECDSVMNSHYHVVLLLNKDAFSHIGDITADKGNLAARIKKAWASALGLELREVVGLVNFTNNGVFYLNRNSASFNADYQNLFFAISYLAKVDTKHYRDGSHSFGYSRR